MLDLEATTQLDTTSADVLTHLAVQLEKRGVNLYLAKPKAVSPTDNGDTEVEQVIEWEQDETSDGDLP